MRKRRNYGVLKKWNEANLVTLVALLTAIVIIITDNKANKETVINYALKDPKKEEMARKTIPVEYEQFVELMESFHRKHRGSIEIETPFFDKNANTTKIRISRGQALLTGKNTDTEWCKDSLCSFHTIQVNDSVVVVSCPADLMARLVEDYE